MTITLHLVRHAQGFHNLSHENEQLPDPQLTPLGLEQCAALRASFPYHDRLTHLVASPMRRTLLTCHHSFTPAVYNPSSNPAGKRIVAQPLVQEVSTQPCDTGSEPGALTEEFGAWTDDALVTTGWNDKRSAESPWRPTIEALENRAREARRWLRELGRQARAQGSEDADIVVVSHGGFLHFLTDDWDGMSLEKGTGWMNTEWRSYEFVCGADDQGEDEDARIRETAGSWKRRRGTEEQLTEAELREAKAVLLEGVRKKLAEMEEAAGGVNGKA
ncbi:phosphoglycerate mutase family protein-like protein [Coniella lustricola]|uniref:Phosphoglycerate mutase family protein-like protein n=1 Tax=Coniella lustricola TaxID=2025994 RepID=A0A2T3AGV0_9PEZI|nr:phosphoglycerate mutase family protein-like protein [Coniella lustricola]